jgi:hypothetical protein
MTTAVYWIHRPEHTDMFTQGYIGVTKHGRQNRRYWEHKTVSGNAHLKSALAKYETQMDIILISDQKYCQDIEFKLRPVPNIGWNITCGGGIPPNFKGRKRSAEFVAKAKMRKDSEETRLKKSLSSMGNKRGLGLKRSAEQKAAISKSMKGKQNALGKQNGLKYRYIGTNIKTGEIITLVGGKPVTDAGFHVGHVSECANGSMKSHKGYTWKKEPIHGKHN